ncbi:MAG: twin-arginine translocation signal domain-containing protein, partial [Planctomycetota bacterium]
MTTQGTHGTHRRDPLTRRDLLRDATAVTAGLVAAGGLPSTAHADPTMEEDDWFRISLAEWSLHRTLRAPADQGGITNLEFPAVAKERFGVDAIEYVNQFFHAPDRSGESRPRGTDFGYLGALRDACEDADVESLLIMVDGEGSLA